MQDVSTIEDKIIAGSLDALAANPNGIIIGEGLANKFRLGMGSTLNVAARRTATCAAMKIVGIFRTGNAGYDEGQTFALLKRAQALLEPAESRQPLIVQLDDPYARARRRGADRATPSATSRCRGRRRPRTC